MNRIKPELKILACWRIWFTAAMTVPALLGALFFSAHSAVWATFIVCWVVVFLAGYLVYLPLRYHKLSFSMTETRLFLYSGVLYTRVRSVSLQNIQFTAVYRSPLDRLFGLASLVAVAAGGRLSLPGLRAEDAQTLSRVLLEPK